MLVILCAFVMTHSTAHCSWEANGQHGYKQGVVHKVVVRRPLILAAHAGHLFIG
jgi:hypothetical protein